MTRLCAICLLFYLPPLQGLTQTCLIYGTVKNENLQALENAVIYVGSNNGVFSDTQGRFCIDRAENGLLELRVQYIGYETYRAHIQVKDSESIQLEIILKETIDNLQEVEIKGKSESKILQETPLHVSVIEAKKFYNTTLRPNDLLNQVTGVRVREQGGLGSHASYMLNGLSGKQVRVFIDGIPIELYGRGMSINVLPVNMIDRIEIYKGAVPVELGADALGGAINVVSRKELKNFTDLSLSYGSFNTYAANLNTRYRHEKTGFTVNFTGFKNHSDNNYPIDATIPDQFGNPQKARVRRFHDQYSNHLLRMDAGFTGKKWADQILLNVFTSGMYNEIQHNAIMSQAYGEANFSEKTHGLSLLYEKQISSRLNINIVSGLNTAQSLLVDTTLNVYTWDGQIRNRRTYGGELSGTGSLQKTQSYNHFYRLNVSYKLPVGQFRLNYFSSFNRRQGQDPVASLYHPEDYSRNPVRMQKDVGGLSYDLDLFEGKLTSVSAVKFFNYRAFGYSVENSVYRENSSETNQPGYSQSFAWRPGKRVLLKTSWEYASRLPDDYELFGDFTIIRPNPYLLPETSHNVNLGGHLEFRKSDINLNFFYRKTSDLIYLLASPFYAQYRNLPSAEIKGIEAEFRFSPLKHLQLKANATFQDIRNTTQVRHAQESRYYNVRMPNIPYFFGNVDMRYQKRVFLKKSIFSIWYNAGYVHEFFLFWSSNGHRDLKNTIPRQFVQYIGTSLTWFREKLTTSFEIHNLANARVYDNFSVQRPGRAFSIKTRLYIN